MQVIYQKSFKKELRKQPIHIQEKFLERLKIFLNNPYSDILNNHALRGTLKGIRSFDVTGDIRVHYIEITGGIILLTIGSHSELYR